MGQPTESYMPNLLARLRVMWWWIREINRAINAKKQV